ncbi:alkaline phosphatase family protein [Intrasporangium sp.]|uniref:alkaline phosphatase family protein n=1 Tax=Intrasporangium sp. TaxID=1925024 RepID=UPI003221F057
MTAGAGPSPAASAGPGFEHLVVLMFENRSFDNLLGHLYPPGTLPEGQRFDGVANGSYHNLSPTGPVAAHVYDGPTDRIMQSPTPDPGEEYQHVNTQLFGIVDPPQNAGRRAGDMVAPWNAPPDGAAPTMGGFVTDYINSFIASQQRQPSPEEYRVIMGSFSPGMLPVTSALARGFAVYDAWFCAVPSQTFCNRSFFNASSSSGFVTNDGGPHGYRKWARNRVPTIFNRLEEAGISWAVYYDESQVVPLTGLINAPALRRFWRTRFFGMRRFYADAAAGRLPAYAFIEPRLVFDHNDMHPPVASFEVLGIPVGAHNDIRAGEQLLHDVYTAVRTSATPAGSNALNTLLLVTFDEHGGCYDHVPPPSAVPPGPVLPAGTVASGPALEPEMDFGFDRLGVRVPTIAISAWTRAGTIIHDEMHHGSAIATLCRKHGLPPLTERDATARDLTNALNLEQPRPVANWPQTHPQPVPGRDDAHVPFAPEQAGTPLTPPASALMGVLTAELGLPDGGRRPTTFGAAHQLLQRGKGLFRI